MFLEQAESVFMAFILCVSGILGREICVLKGSTVDLTCSPQHNSSSVEWFTFTLDGYNHRLYRLPADGNRRTWNKSGENHPTLTIRDVRMGDEDDYCCNSNTIDLCWGNIILLRVTGTDGKNRWSRNYVSRRICALKGSTVDISSEYTLPSNDPPKFKLWYKIRRINMMKNEEVLQPGGQVQYQDVMNKRHILRITNLKKNDSAQYVFRLWGYYAGVKDGPAVTLVVTGLKVRFTPSAEVNEGEKVKLTCSTSCPLTDNTSYIWSLNGRPLTLPENQLKHLTIDPVSSQHAGKYSCSVKTSSNEIMSGEETLTVQHVTEELKLAVASGVGGGLLVVIVALVVFLWMRRKKTSRPSTKTEAPDNSMQMNPALLYESVSFPQKEQEELPYGRIQFSKTEIKTPQSSTETHEPQEQDVTYAVVNFRSTATNE